MRRRNAWTGLWVVVLLLASGSSLWAQQDVSIVWDRYGVPHVTADSDRGAFFGAGYAMARDRLFQMHWNRLIYEGRTAEFFGRGEGDHNIREDRKARTLGWARHADRVIAALPRGERELLDGFAAGVNAYTASQGAQFHPLFRSYGIPVEPWRARDCVGVWTRLARYFGSLGGNEAAQRHLVDDMLAAGSSREEVLSALFGDAMAIDREAVVQQADVPAGLQREMAKFARRFGVSSLARNGENYYTPAFSQALVVAGRRTPNGRAILLGEPRVPVYAPNMFFELHMKGATFEARGIAIPGVPYFLSGSTPLTAWSPTAMGADQADLFRLTVDPSRPGEYQLDGRWLTYRVEETEVIAVRGGPSQSLVYRETVWGPVVGSPLVGDVRPGEVYALKAVPLATPDQHALRGFLDLYRARDVDQMFTALGGWSWPSANVVFADARGRIGYTPVGTIPIRKAHAALAGVIAQDGDTLANDWQGFLPGHLRPHVIDPASGALVTANHLPVGSWYPMRSLYPGLGDTTRSRRLKELVAARPILDVAQLRRIHLDRVSSNKRDLVRLALVIHDDLGFEFSANAQQALRALEGWLASGARLDATHGGVSVAHYLRETLRRVPDGPILETWGAGQSGLSNFLEERLRGLRLTPPVLPTREEAAAVEGLLEQALTRLFTAFPELQGAPIERWRDHYVTHQLTGELPRFTALGQPQALSRGVVAYGPLISAHKMGNLAQSADCYTQLVEVGKTDGAETMLAIGQSEHEGSAHERDQQRLWERGELKPAPFSPRGIRALGIEDGVRLTSR